MFMEWGVWWKPHQTSCIGLIDGTFVWFWSLLLLFLNFLITIESFKDSKVQNYLIRRHNSMQTVDHNNIKMRSTFTYNQKPYDFCAVEPEQSIQGLLFAVYFLWYWRNKTKIKKKKLNRPNWSTPQQNCFIAVNAFPFISVCHSTFHVCWKYLFKYVLKYRV